VHKHRMQGAIEIAIATCVGPVAAIAPLYLWPPALEYKAPLLPIVRTAVENADTPSLWLLACLSIILGLTTNRNKGWVLGELTMVLFPIVAIAEVIVDQTSHNLFPLEIIQYGVTALIPVGCVYLGRRAKTLFRRMKRSGEKVS